MEKLNLTIDEKARSGYYPLKAAVVGPTSTDTSPLFVDDLRGPDDPSLGPVPRITTFEQLVDVFHLGVATRFGGGEAPPGSKYFRLVGFYLRTGVAAFIPKVLDENGNPLPQIFVWASWPGAPPFPQGARVVPNYSVNGGGVGGFTNADGDIGFGYFGDAVIGDNGGVFSIWPSADPEGLPRQWADCAVKLGWHGATDHLTPNPVYQVVTKSGDEPQPPPTGDEHTIDLLIDGIPIFSGKLQIETTLRVVG